MGLRPIGMHLQGLRELGFSISDGGECIFCKAVNVAGANVSLGFPSVGATENIMLASIFAKGETVISNAAREPEIVDLEKFLNGMGAKIKGAGTNTIVISGVEKLHDVSHYVMPDRIVAGTYLVAAAITKGNIVLTGVNGEDLTPIIAKLEETGCTIKEKNSIIVLDSPIKLKSVRRVITLPHPGFPTDMQPQLMSLLSVSDGVSIMEETVFEERTKHISELQKLGANITLLKDNKTTVINGVKKLIGCEVNAKDLRSGAALIIAGLCAEGNTTVTGSEHVQRGYEKIETDLSHLGANIKFLDCEE